MIAGKLINKLSVHVLNSEYKWQLVMLKVPLKIRPP